MENSNQTMTTQEIIVQLKSTCDRLIDRIETLHDAGALPGDSFKGQYVSLLYPAKGIKGLIETLYTEQALKQETPAPESDPHKNTCN